ncbi:MAG: putative transrane protein [Pseudomonas sp.]|nr:putative transrane protein [Pseudomonas sp.]
MSNSNQRVIAEATSRLMPNRATDRSIAIPRDLPGIVIFLHGVNDPGASYESVETGLCQGLNERLDRPDLQAGRYGVKYSAAKNVPAKERNSQQIEAVDDPDTFLYQRDADGDKARSVLIPFYWGYRAAPEDIKRDDQGVPLKMRNQYQDVNGNRLDRHFGKGGGFFTNATNNLKQMYGEGFKRGGKTDLAGRLGGNYLHFGDAPERHYFVMAAHRLAMLISEIRRLSPDDTVTVIGHSQGTLISLLAQTLLVDKGQRCADTVIMVDSPYSVLPTVTPADHDTLATLIRIVTAVTEQPHTQPPLSELRKPETYCGRTGPKWSPQQGTRLDTQQQMTVFPERDNRGKVYLYFCPDDTTVALGEVQGIGTYGVPDTLPNGKPAMQALQPLRFFQRMWTKRHRDGEPVLVGKAPQSELMRVAGEARYPGGYSIPAIASQAPIPKAEQRLINAEQLNPPHAPQMFGGEAISGTPTSAGRDKPDDVGKSVALGKEAANFLWVRMPAEYDSPFTTQDEALKRYNALSEDPEEHTRAVRLYQEPGEDPKEARARESRRARTHHEREETPKEARERMEEDRNTWEPNSYHSAILRSPENQRWVTAMDVAVGKAECLNDPALREVLIAIADWKITEELYVESITAMQGWKLLSPEAQALVEASYLYYDQGISPTNSVVSLDFPALVSGQIRQEETHG